MQQQRQQMPTEHLLAAQSASRTPFMVFSEFPKSSSGLGFVFTRLNSSISSLPGAHTILFF